MLLTKRADRAHIDLSGIPTGGRLIQDQQWRLTQRQGEPYTLSIPLGELMLRWLRTSPSSQHSTTARQHRVDPFSPQRTADFVHTKLWIQRRRLWEKADAGARFKRLLKVSNHR